jgi:hypothetical protein
LDGSSYWRNHYCSNRCSRGSCSSYVSGRRVLSVIVTIVIVIVVVVFVVVLVGVHVSCVGRSGGSAARGDGRITRSRRIVFFFLPLR